MNPLGSTCTRKTKASRAMARAAKKGPAEVLRSYVGHIQDIDVPPPTDYLLESEIFCDENLENYDNVVRFSCIFNDLSYFCFKGGHELKMHLILQEGFKKIFGTDKLTYSIPLAEMKRLGVHPHQFGEINVSPCFAMRSDEIINPVLRSLVPLIGSGRLVVRPARLVGIQICKRTQFLGAHRDSPLDIWDVREDLNGSNKPAPIRMGDEMTGNEAEMFKICIPFIEGMSFKDLDSVITDEHDHISSLRVSLKDIIVQAKQGSKTTQEMVRDVIEPKLDRLGRRFKVITSMHRRKLVGAGVCTALLSFVAAKTSGANTLAVLGGAGGLGFWFKERAEFYGQIAELKEDPLYFLWRCRELRPLR